MSKLDVIRASAGSGKTTELVRAYLGLIFSAMSREGEGSNYYRHVLAITFTNKATNEMKMRILTSLKEIATSLPGKSRIAGEIAVEIDQEESWLKEKAGIILADILHNYHYFAISTIDRFFTGLVRGMSFELAIPSGREIELNREKIISAGIENLFEKFTAGNEITEFAVELSSLKFHREKSTSIEAELRVMAKEILGKRDNRFLEKCAETDPSEFRKARKAMYAIKSSAESELRSAAEEIVKFLSENEIGTGELRNGKSGFFAEVSRFYENEKEWPELTENRKKITDGGKLTSSAADKQKTILIDSMSQPLSSLATKFIFRAESLAPGRTFSALMIPRIHSMAMAGGIGRELLDYKAEQDIAELSDYDMLISEIVKSSPVPYIYERTGEKYHHYLVDEFQDTSSIQWTNLVPLLANGLSEGFNSLIVGDEKQAIYRWRGGESGQLTSLVEGKDSYEDVNLQVIGRSTIRKSLTSNRRSSVSVVDFVNKFFARLMPEMPDRIKEAYKGHLQTAGEDKIKGSVEIRFKEDTKDKETTASWVIEAVEMYAKAGYGFGDMAILCRSSKQCGEITELLTSHKINVLSSQGMKLDASPEVQFLVSWLIVIYRDWDEIALYRIFDYLTSQLDESSRGEIIASWPDQERRASKLAELSNGLDIHALRSQSLTEACITIVSSCLSDKSGDPFIAAFIDCLNDFESRHGKDIAEFLTWWSNPEGGPELEMPEATTAVRVMTIHKAKGLEFKITIAPFMSGSIEPSQGELWTETIGEDAKIIPYAWLPASEQLLQTRYAKLYEEEMERSLLDELNIMYVAMTRASHHLFIISGKPGVKNLSSRESLLSRCFEIEGHDGDKEALVFRSGKIEVYKDEHKPSPEPGWKGSLAAEWRSRVRLKYRNEDKVFSGEVVSPSDYGNLVHDIMAAVRNLSDLPRVLEMEVAAGIISVPQADSLFKAMESCIMGSEVEALFSQFKGSIFMEREMITKDGRLLRPDRIAMTDSEIILLDYKTGQPDESHNLQINDYISALRDQTDKKISAYLLYIGKGEVRRLA